MSKQSAPPAQFTGAPWQQSQGAPGTYEGHPPRNMYEMSHAVGAAGGGASGGLDFGAAAAQQGKDSQAAVNQQTQNNRPDQSNAFGTTSQWHQGPDGKWTQSTSFGGDLGNYVHGLEGQLAGQGALDFSGLPKLGTGEEARQHAEDALYSRASSRLDPQWNQREQAQRTQLLNEGLDPSSAAYTKAMDDLSRQRNDAYSTARNDAITGGGAEASRQYSLDLNNRQQMLAEMLRKRADPMMGLQGLQGFQGQQQFSQAGAATPAPWLQAVTNAGNYQLGRTSQANQNSADFMSGLFGAVKAGAQVAGMPGMMPGGAPGGGFDPNGFAGGYGAGFSL
jgi:hypothetical protein